MTDAPLPFVAVIGADDRTVAVLMAHAERVTGTLRGTGWQCHSLGAKVQFSFASLAQRDRFVSFVWGVEHLRAEIVPSPASDGDDVQS